MSEETLETVAEDLGDIVIESHEGILFFGDGRTIDENNPLPVQIIDPSSESESYEEEESIEVHYLEEATVSEKIELESVAKYESNSRASSVTEFKNLWKVSISGQEYDVLFPANATLEVINGKLYNTGSSTVTGTIIDSSFSDTSYSRYTLSVLPVTSSSTQTSVYRYGARSYITEYSPGLNNNLTSTATYVQVGVVDRPVGWSLTPRDWVVCALLLFSILVTILGGIFRR